MLLCIPGEPFTEIGMRLKSEYARQGRAVLVVSHCGANIAYIPNVECFGEGRGGYEVQPMSSPNSSDTATRMCSAVRTMASGLIEADKHSRSTIKKGA